MDHTFSESNIWESVSNPFTIVESASSEVDGVHILAKVVGPAFFPETTSRNKVFYSTEAWETAISDETFRARLRDRLVYGTIGHNADLTDDDIREGRFSHIVIRVWIDENNVGMGEYLVLNTPPGRILNTLLRSGSRLRVSTKAAGYFANEKSGVKAVISDSFRLERIDFVIDPGYREALPEVIESLNDPLTILNSKGNDMDKVVDILESRVQELKQEKGISEAVAKELQAEIRKISEANVEVSTQLKQYVAFGTPIAVQESMSELAQYQQLGTVHEIHEALEQGSEVIDELTDTVKELEQQAYQEPEEYKDLGTPGDIRTALDQALTCIDELRAYRELGSVDEIQELISQADIMSETLADKEAENLAATLDVDKEVVTTLLGKGLTLEECSEILGKVKQPAVSESDAVEPVDPTLPTDPVEGEGEGEEEENDDNEEEEEEEENPSVSESLSSRILRGVRARTAPSKIQESAALNKQNSLIQKLMR